MRSLFIFFLVIFTFICKAQTTQDSLAELQSLLDSIPDISLAELGIDTTAEIVPDTLHLVIPAYNASDTAYARTCLNQAIDLIKTGKYDDAYVKADTAKHIYQMNIGYVTKEVADCLHQMGRSLYFVGKYDDAVRLNIILFNLTYKLRRKLYIDMATPLNLIGLSLNLLGYYEKSVKCHQKSLKIRMKFLGKMHIDVAGSYNNIAITYKSIGQYDKALYFFKKALEIGINYFGNSHFNIGSTLNNIGITYGVIGQNKKAIEFLEKALQIYLNILGTKHPYTASVYHNIGNNLYTLGDYYRSIQYLKKGLDLRLNCLNLNHPDISTSYTSLGNSYLVLKRYKEALENLKMGLDLKLNSVSVNQLEIANSFNNLGNLYNHDGKFEEALIAFNKALEIHENYYNNIHPNLSLIYGNIGSSYSHKGEFTEAIHFFKKALQITFYNLKLNHSDLIHYRKFIAITYHKLNQLDSSIFYLHQAISGIKTQMVSNISAETKNLYQSQNIPVFESAIDVSLLKSKQDQHDSLKLKTYEYTELAKASLLQSQIKQTDALAFAGIPNSLLQKEYDLRIDINWREKQRQGLLEKGKTETDQEVLRISSIIFDLKREQESLIETLEKDYPEYYRLKYDTKTISLEDTQQKLLQKGQTLLEYFVGDSSIFIFVIRPDTFDVVQVKKDFPLDSLVRQMQSGLYGYYGQSPNKRSDFVFKNSILDYSNAANELYQRIMGPVAHLLTSDLVIIPDGVLGYVPFEALLKSKPEKLNQFGSYPYMINDHTISYNYSATLWNEMKSKKHKKEPSKSLVAFAPFYKGSYTVLDSTINLVLDTLSDERDTTIFQDVVSRKTYAPLPSSGIEAGTVSKLYKGDYFVNSDATEQKFYNVAGDYRIVHLSTHGVADARQGDYSYLAFAEQKDSIENEFLYVRDIYNTQLNADLVFLSACETAQGELQRGEGIISLARAFAYAGAKSIITTLWQVDDAANKDISIDFYKNLKKGFTKDVALRQAKLRHIKSARSAQKHPFFWAAMIGIGDMEREK